jgi:hypothetical protein
MEIPLVVDWVVQTAAQTVGLTADCLEHMMVASSVEHWDERWAASMVYLLADAMAVRKVVCSVLLLVAYLVDWTAALTAAWKGFCSVDRKAVRLAV